MWLFVLEHNVIDNKNTLNNKNVLIILDFFLKKSRKKLTITNGGLELFAVCICNKEPRFLPPCIPPRLAKSWMKIVQKCQLWSISYIFFSLFFSIIWRLLRLKKKKKKMEHTNYYTQSSYASIINWSKSCKYMIHCSTKKIVLVAYSLATFSI